MEKNDKLREKLLLLPPSTLEVLVYQINEILNTQFQKKKKFNQHCYFAMSINDPLLDFSITKTTLKRLFHKVSIEEFDFPYHQPPNLFTFEELNGNYTQLLGQI